MIRLFKLKGKGIEPTDEIKTNTWIRITEPTIEELKTISTQLDVDMDDLSAALDSEESSRWETSGKITNMIIDIPHRTVNELFVTAPLSIILTEFNVITVCSTVDDIDDKRFIQTFNEWNYEDMVGFVIHIMYVVSKEYQKNLREIDANRKKMESKLNSQIKNSDMLDLHRMETSLVHFITSLKGCNLVLGMMNKNIRDKVDKTHVEKLDDVMIENQQAIEMASIYREIVDSTRDLFSTVINGRLNVNMRWLTAVTIILSIPMIIASIYGMNVSLPLESDRAAFTILISIMFISCVASFAWLKKKRLI